MPKRGTTAIATERASRLDRALHKNDMVKDIVEQSSDELFVINTVLKQKIPHHFQAGDVEQALQKSGELENKIQESAENLAQVNQLLEEEINERTELERQLKATEKALAVAKTSPAE